MQFVQRQDLDEGYFFQKPVEKPLVIFVKADHEGVQLGHVRKPHVKQRPHRCQILQILGLNRDVTVVHI